MQVQHEARLLDAATGNPPRRDADQPTAPVAAITGDGQRGRAHSPLDLYVLASQWAPIQPIRRMASCPAPGSSSSLLAVYLAPTNQLLLYDTRSHARRDRFPLKPCDRRYSRHSFQVSAMEFSPDGSRLAVGQTDCIIYIYKFTAGAAHNWSPPQLAPQTDHNKQTTNQQTGQPNASSSSPEKELCSLKPTISGKFACSSPISCLIWCELGIVFGSHDGKVRAILMQPPSTSTSTSTSSSTSGGQQPAASPAVLAATLAPAAATTAAAAPATTAAAAAAEQNHQLGPPSSSSSGQPRVVTLFSALKSRQMPISLAYRAPQLLVVGLSDHSIQLIQVQLQEQTSEQPHLHGQLNGADSLQQHQQARRNSSQAAQQVSATLVAHTDHSCPPSRLLLLHDHAPHQLCCAGSDGRLAFHSLQQQQQQQPPSAGKLTATRLGGGGAAAALRWLQNIDLKEDILALDYSQINEVLAVGLRSRILFAKYDQESSGWHLEASSIELTAASSAAAGAGGGGLGRGEATRAPAGSHHGGPPALALTSLLWTRDGAQLVAGLSNGCVELFRCSWSRQSVGEQLDICHIARNRVRITDRERNLLATYKTAADIKRVNLLDGGQSVLIWSQASLLLARLGQPQLQSEIRWQIRDLRALKFLFEASGFVVVHCPSTGELRVIKLGESQVLLSRRVGGHSLSRRLISVRCFPPPPPPPAPRVGPNQTNAASPTRSRGTSARSSSLGTSAARDQPANLVQQQQQQGDFVLAENGTEATGGGLAARRSSTNADQQQQQQRPRWLAQVERLAYVDATQDASEIQCVDLVRMRDFRVQLAAGDQRPSIGWLEFSHTSRYLAVRTKPLGGLYVIEFADTDETSDRSTLRQLAGSGCGHASWLPETDCLVAQVRHEIRVWYDLGEPTKYDSHDTRAFNVNGRPPLLDLSLLSTCSTSGQESPSSPRFPIIIPNGGPDQHDEIKLSNGQAIGLDKLRVRFHQLLQVHRRPEAAHELLLLSPPPPPPPPPPPAGHRESTEVTGQATTTTSGHQWRRRSFAKLGWLAVEELGNCELAIRAFQEIGYSSLVSYLSDAINASRMDTEAKTTGGGEEEDEMGRGMGPVVEIQLAKLCGHWDKFEQLAGHDEIVATYRRLNRWIRCLNYLESKQQFRQRDLAERERCEWLVARGRHLEAAQIQLRASGDLRGALELLAANGRHSEACQLFVEHQRAPLVASGGGDSHSSRQLMELATSLQSKLIDDGAYREAALLGERVLGSPVDEALDLYLRGNAYKEALQLLENQESTNDSDLLAQRRAEVQLQFARHLEDQLRRQLIGRRRAGQAVDLYLAGGRPLEAARLAIELKQLDRAYEILAGQPDDVINGRQDDDDDETYRSLCRRLGQLLLVKVQQDDHDHDDDHEDERRPDKAVAMLERAQDWEQLVGVLIELGQYPRAYEVSLVHLYANDRQRANERLLELANECVAKATEPSEQQQQLLQLQRAEQIYLLAERPELAIEMYRAREMYERMLELMGQHQADQLEGCLLQLARHFESRGQLEAAERYLLRASPAEWTNAVRMYRLAGRWADAYRVARANCQSERDPLLVQLAYWWARSLATGGGLAAAAEARHLLDKLGLLHEVVEFCCTEIRAHQFALDLVGHGREEADHHEGSRELRRRLVVRYANYLEQQHKFEQAKELLVGEQLVEQAARMYIDNDRPLEAISLIEQQIESSGGGGGGAGEAQRTATSDQAQQQQPLVDLLNRTLIDCARRLTGDVADQLTAGGGPTTTTTAAAASLSRLAATRDQLQRLQQAQQMYLRAQRPELAIEMYKARGMWQEAVQVAQRFAPRLLESVERSLDEQVTDDIGPILRQFEAARGAPSGQRPAELGGREEINSEDAASRETRRPESNGWSGASRKEQPDERRPTTLGRELALLLTSLGDDSQGDGGGIAAKRTKARMLLARLLGSTVDQLGVGTTTLGSLGATLAELEQLFAARTHNLGAQIGLVGEENLDKVTRLADFMLLNCDWQGAAAGGEQQANSNIWWKLCNILKVCLPALSRPQSSNSTLNSSSSESRMSPGATGHQHHHHQAEQLERRLLAAHCVALHCDLVNQLVVGPKPRAPPPTRRVGTNGLASSNPSGGQLKLSISWVSQLSAGGQLTTQANKWSKQQQRPQGDSPPSAPKIVGSLARVSLSLLTRFVDLVDPLRCLYFAGLWQLAARQPELARPLWSALLELSDLQQHPSTARPQGDHEPGGSQDHHRSILVALNRKLGDLARRLEVPVERQLRFGGQLLPVDQRPASQSAAADAGGPKLGVGGEQLAEVRQWLLESLIIGPQTGDTSSLGPASSKIELGQNELEQFLDEIRARYLL